MRKFTLLLSILFIGSAFASPNNVSNPPRYFSNNTAVPNYNNNGTNWNMPNMNWGNGNGYNNGSNWNMPSMNWGNGNGYNSGSSWNMPNMNWGNNGGGNNWNMPSMNWGNNNGYGNGSNWNMPNMNWGNNYNNGSNWNNQQRPWNFGSGNNYNNRFAPGIQQRAPMMPIAPRFAPQRLPNPNVNQPPQMMLQQEAQSQNIQMNAADPTPASQTNDTDSKIPMPNEVKDVILAPENKAKQTQETPQ